MYRIDEKKKKKFLLELKRDPTVPIGAFGNSDEENETFQSKNEPISDDTPETLFAAKEIANTVNVAMQALPEDLRQAITLREIDGLEGDDNFWVHDHYVTLNDRDSERQRIAELAQTKRRVSSVDLPEEHLLRFVYRVTGFLRARFGIGGVA